MTGGQKGEQTREGKWIKRVLEVSLTEDLPSVVNERI